MHTVEAFLAVADAAGKEEYRVRAGRIIDHVLGWASANEWRIPEHFTKDWTPDLECNKEQPADQFKPYGATPGHGIEWARLITQWALSTYKDDAQGAARYIEATENLFNRAVEDAWNADGLRVLSTLRIGMENRWSMTVCTGLWQRRSILPLCCIMLREKKSTAGITQSL